MILGDAGYCSSAGIESVHPRGADVVVRGQGEPVAGRIGAVRKSEQAIRSAHRRIEWKAHRQKTKTQPETWEYAQ